MHSLLATSTHDTKHGEDTRARINVLSEQPEEWESALRRWSAFNKGSKTSDNGNLLPSYNDEYRFYQALIGTWAEKHLANLDLYRIRMVEYMLKAVREAKEQTSWVDQDEGYENALKSFVSKVLSPGLDNRFLPDFRVFARRVSFFGYLNSLSQVLLKTVSPGVPDFYQGSELWDLALVDPDNRRPVDYQERQGLLTHLELQCARVQRHEFLQELCGDISNGAVKMFVMWRLLHFRRDYFRLFEAGRYLPCTVRGSKSAHVCSFARALDAHTVVAVAPRLISKLMNGEERLPQGLGVWGDTSITWPGLQEGSHFHEIFSDRALIAERYGDDAVLRVGDILTEFPIALLCSTP